MTVIDCNGCAAVESIVISGDACTQECGNLVVDLGSTRTECGPNPTLTANFSGATNCNNTRSCNIQANATELVRWNMNGCNPAGPAGDEDCNTNGPTIISNGGCANISATAPCNQTQLDFSCNNGFAGGAGVCFPADPRTFYEKNDGDDLLPLK